MNWNIQKCIILLLINIYALSVHCQNEDETDSFNDYDIIKSIKKLGEDISKSENLKLISEEEKTFINAFQEYLPKYINPILFSEMLSETSSDKCEADLNYMAENSTLSSDWSMKMYDSFGKPESGILLGNARWLGEYDECLKVHAPPKGETGIGDFHGKYCTLIIPLKIGNMSLTISTAVCIPDSCNPNGTLKGLPISFSLPGMDEILEPILSNATITCQPKSKELTNGAIVVITLLSIISLLAVIGSLITALEYYIKTRAAKEQMSSSNLQLNKPSALNGDVEIGSNNEDLLLGANNEVKLPAWIENCKPFFNCFCLFTNGERILNTTSAEGQLPCLHGIRFYSMAWVVLGHSYQGILYSVRNPLEIIDFFKPWTAQVITNGIFSVDTFFMLSGFLVGYVYFTEATKKDGKIPWLYFYVHRYIRLTPVYMLVLGFYATVEPLLESGPISANYTVIPACQDGWWWNLLYINNFRKDTECMTWLWYIANDMQFYVVSPLFLITLYRWPKIGCSLLGLMFCITSTINFTLTYVYDLVPGSGNVVEYAQELPTYLKRIDSFYNKIYTKPYARIGTYLVGLLLAYILHKRKQNNSLQLKTITLRIGWILSSAITLACLFGITNRKVSTLEASFYNSLSRIGFASGIAWVIFVCVTGQGNIVNRILGWKVLIPLSRLTYCAYLVHPIVQSIYLGSLRRLLEFNTITVVRMYLGTMFISYFAAFVTSVLLESPVIRLERLLRNKLSSKKNS